MISIDDVLGGSGSQEHDTETETEQQMETLQATINIYISKDICDVDLKTSLS